MQRIKNMQRIKKEKALNPLKCLADELRKLCGLQMTVSSFYESGMHGSWIEFSNKIAK